jgi:thiol-disulfide isomerase/thioredoxin
MRLAQVAQVLFMLAAAVGVYSFVAAARKDQEWSSCQALCHLHPSYAGRDRKVPDFELPDLQGNRVRFSSFLGKQPVVLNFWTKTCQPCLEEMPKLAEFAVVAASRGVRVVTVTTDEDPEDVRQTLDVVLQGKAPPFVVLLDPDAEVVTDRFGTTLYPETWMIDKKGIIRARIDGNPEERDVPWTDPIPLEVLDTMSRPFGCLVEFQHGCAVRFENLCDVQQHDVATRACGAAKPNDCETCCKKKGAPCSRFVDNRCVCMDG